MHEETPRLLVVYGCSAAPLRICRSPDLDLEVAATVVSGSSKLSGLCYAAKFQMPRSREADKRPSLLVMMIRQTRDLSGSSQLGKSLFFLRLLRTSATDLCMSNSGDTFEALAGQKVLPSACSAEFRTTY
jgi:hypothetical protein